MISISFLFKYFDDFSDSMDEKQMNCNIIAEWMWSNGIITSVSSSIWSWNKPIFWSNFSMNLRVNLCTQTLKFTYNFDSNYVDHFKWDMSDVARSRLNKMLTVSKKCSAAQNSVHFSVAWSHKRITTRPVSRRRSKCLLSYFM